MKSNFHQGFVVSADGFRWSPSARTAHTGIADTSIGNTGNLTDVDTGLVYLRARDYYPAARQFLTVDPVVNTTSRSYAHVANDPVTRTDPTGLSVSTTR